MSSSARLIHDHAFQMAQKVLGTVKDCLMEQEHRDALQAFYEIAKDELEKYETATDRMMKRLKPSRN